MHDSEMLQAGNYSGTNATIKKGNEIGTVLIKLQQTIEIAQKTFGGLSERMTLVLNGGGLLGKTDKGSLTPQFTTPLAQNIDESIKRLEALISHMEEISRRLEL